MAEHEERAGGTLLRGADGALYFIPDDKLDAFRVPQDKVAPTRKLLGARGDVLDVSILRGPAVRKAGLAASETTTVSVANVGAIRQGR